MGRKVIWLLGSCLMVLALLAAACAPAAEKETAPLAEQKAPSEPGAAITPPSPTAGRETVPAVEEIGQVAGTDTVKLSLTKLDGSKVETTLEKPKYGGTFVQVFNLDPGNHDIPAGGSNTVRLTQDTLFETDWTRGPKGTNEVSMIFRYVFNHLVTDGLASTNWELTDPTTMVFHIRKGIYFHDKPPTNGRELTADDVAFSFERLWADGSKSSHRTVYPYIESITAPDKWTVVVKTDPGQAGPLFEYASQQSPIVPRDAAEKYDLNEWRNNIGTGPFMLTDYVAMSSATLVRNPNYWHKDPFFPENQLPYVDGVRQLIIPDASTRLAAMRTGKISALRDVGWEDARSLQRSAAYEFESRYASGAHPALYPRVDKPELPLSDLKVRRAMRMAVNDQEIIDTLYGGEASLLEWPAFNIPEFKDVHVPLDQLPESTQELFEYHPDKAKQLLAEAGYPNGFQAKITMATSDTDLMSVVKAYWAEVGVDLVLDVREPGTLRNMKQARTFEEIVAHPATGAWPHKMPNDRWPAGTSYTLNQDPVIMKAYEDAAANYFDLPKRNEIVRQYVPHTLGQTYLMLTPAPRGYFFWQPWVKGYSGEANVSYLTDVNFIKHVWIDQKLKESMGY